MPLLLSLVHLMPSTLVNSDTSVAWIHPVSGRLQTKKCGDAVISITVSSVDGYTSFFKTVNLNVSPTIPNYWGGYHGNLRWDLDKDGVLCFSGQGELVNKDRLIGEREGEVTLRGYMEWDYHTGDYVFVPYDRPWSGHFVDGKEVDVKRTILMEGIVGIVDAPPFMRINKLPSTLRFIDGAYDGECLDPECELPEGLDRIGERVFASWSTLPPDNGVRINIPSTVRSIGSLGLGRFRDIDTIVFLSPTPPSVFGTSNWFSYYNTQDGYPHFESKYGIWTQPTLVSTIYVPQGFEDVYREHPVWGNYQIVGLDAITLDLEHIPSPIKPKEETLSPYYDLLGNPKNYQTKGIYIHNGKKILIQ